MNSKVPTGSEILSHETKISDVFRMMINTPTHFIHYSLSLSLIEEAFEKMSLQFFRAKELRS